MSDTPAPVSPDPTVGEQVDAAVGALRAELSSKVDSLQAKVDELSAKIDAIQGQTQSQ